MFANRYGVAATFLVPMIKRGSQDYALSADWTPATGDVKVSIDGGNVANIATLPTIVGGTGGAVWKFSLSAAEMTGKRITVQVVDSATKAVEDQTFIVRTFGHALANDPQGAILSGVPQGVAAQAITLASGQVGSNDRRNGNRIEIMESDVAADVGQVRQITSSTSSSDVCGVDRPWEPALTGTLATIKYNIYGDSLPSTVTEIAAPVLTVIGTPVGADLSADIAAVQTTADAIETDVAAVPAATTTAVFAKTFGSKWLNWTFEQFLKVIGAATVGKGVGLDTTSPKYRNANDDGDVISATGADSDGNRGTITYTPDA